MPRCGASEFFFFHIPDVFAETIIGSGHQISHFYKSRCRRAGWRAKAGSEKPKITDPAVAGQGGERKAAARNPK